MKKIIIPLVVVMFCNLVLSSCKKTTEVALNQTVDSTAVLLYEGDFINGPYGNVNGKAKIYRQLGNLTLALENFNSNSGPDLKVYLSKEVMPVNFISLGALQSTNGNQLYSISGMPDFESYKYVLIHCEQYNHLFGSAALP